MPTPTGGVDQPRKPRKKIAADLRSLARGHTDLCVKVFAGIFSQEAWRRLVWRRPAPAGYRTAPAYMLERENMGQ